MQCPSSEEAFSFVIALHGLPGEGLVAKDIAQDELEALDDRHLVRPKACSHLSSSTIPADARWGRYEEQPATYESYW